MLFVTTSIYRHKHDHPRKHPHACMHARTQTCILTHIHTNAQTQTHTQTHSHTKCAQELYTVRCKLLAGEDIGKVDECMIICQNFPCYYFANYYERIHVHVQLSKKASTQYPRVRNQLEIVKENTTKERNFPRNLSFLTHYSRGIIQIAHLSITKEYSAIVSTVLDALIIRKILVPLSACLHSKGMLHLHITRDNQRCRNWEIFQITIITCK